MSEVSGPSSLWFERLYAYLRLPFWAGALLFGIGLLTVVTVVAIAVGDLWDFVPIEFQGAVAIYGVMGLFTQLAARAARRGVERMGEYTKPMRDRTPLALGPLYSPGFTFLTYGVLEVAIQPFYILYGISESLTLAQRIIISVPFMYVDLFAFTFLWVLGYSFYAIYRVGRMELNLKPFTEDRSLGLNPLGRLALRLSGLYVLFVLFALVPNLLSVILAPPIVAIVLALTLLSFAFFFLPLLPLRRKLLTAKRDLLGRLGPRLTRLYREVDSEPGGKIGQEVVNELMALKEIQRDIQQIHNWPFDTGVVVRLSVIVFSVTAIVLSRIIASIFGV